MEDSRKETRAVVEGSPRRNDSLPGNQDGGQRSGSEVAGSEGAGVSEPDFVRESPPFEGRPEDDTRAGDSGGDVGSPAVGEVSSGERHPVPALEGLRGLIAGRRMADGKACGDYPATERLATSRRRKRASHEDRAQSREIERGDGKEQQDEIGRGQRVRSGARETRESSPRPKGSKRKAECSEDGGRPPEEGASRKSHVRRGWYSQGSDSSSGMEDLPVRASGSRVGEDRRPRGGDRQRGGVKLVERKRTRKEPIQPKTLEEESKEVEPISRVRKEEEPKPRKEARRSEESSAEVDVGMADELRKWLRDHNPENLSSAQIAAHLVIQLKRSDCTLGKLLWASLEPPSKRRPE